MTPQEAKELALEVWEYLKEHPEIRKKGLPKGLRDKISIFFNYCPLCELFIGETYEYCPKCPLRSCDLGSAFYDWDNSCSNKKKMKAATKIVEILKAWEPDKEASHFILDENIELTAERDRWKARAEKAEKSLTLAGFTDRGGELWEDKFSDPDLVDKLFAKLAAEEMPGCCDGCIHCSLDDEEYPCRDCSVANHSKYYELDEARFPAKEDQ